MAIELVYNSTETISASIEEVFKTIAEAVAIVVVVILLFLGSFRSVLMPVVTIPLSLIGVCAFLLALGYSINLLSLLAMVLAIGLVVDDAIVVVENIHRHIEEGLTPMDAAILGMKEITGPVVAMTLTLAAVLAPLAFTGGLTGALFREFAFTLAGAVIISGIVALTITPMMAARILKSGEPGRFQRFVDRSFDRVANWYERRVSSSLDYRPVTLLMVLALARRDRLHVHQDHDRARAGGGPGRALRDPERRRATRPATTPSSTPTRSRELTAGHPRGRAPSSRSSASAARRNSGFYIWVLKDWADRDRVAGGDPAGHPGPARQGRRRRGLRLRAADAARRRRRPADLGGHPVDPRPGAGLRGRRGGASMKAQASGRFIVVQNSLAFDAPQVTVTIDRDRAASAQRADQRDRHDARPPGRRRLDRRSSTANSNSYDIITQVPREWRDNPEALGRLLRARRRPARWCRCPRWSPSRPAPPPAAIEQFNQLNSATISALPLPGVSTGDGLAAIQGIAQRDAARGLLHRLLRPVAARGRSRATRS